MKNYNLTNTMPTNEGFFWTFWGQFLPEHLKTIYDDIATFYLKIKDTPAFRDQLKYYHKHYIGRPSPIYYCKNLTEAIWWAKIYLKREDLNHTWAHKINHCIGHALVAKMMGKKKIMAETGAWQHGVALATACAVVGIPCEIYMGSIDIAKEYPNVQKMKVLWAKVVSVDTGTKTLKDAVDAAFVEYMKDPEHIFFGIGSVVWPHPFPMMVRDYQSIIWEEARDQFLELENKLPDNLVACVGGWSNAMGLFTAFLEDKVVDIYAVEPGGKSTKLWEHAATLTFGKESVIHGMHTLVIQDEKGEPAPVYSIASGLDYPWVGPQISYLKTTGRIQGKVIDDTEVLSAFQTLSQKEGIIPALESAHAIAYAMKLAKKLDKNKTILVNLSGRGDKDMDFVMKKLAWEG